VGAVVVVVVVVVAVEEEEEEAEEEEEELNFQTLCAIVIRTPNLITPHPLPFIFLVNTIEHPQRLIIRAMLRRMSVMPDSSASRMVVPV
jgi:hypothetical protein